MAKNPNSKSKQVQHDAPLNGAMKFFLAGCVAELYLLIVRRFYINGTAVQQIAWYDSYLKIFMGVGAAVLALGAVLSVLWKADKHKRSWGWSVLGLGLFVSAASFLIWKLNTAAVTLLTVVVPVVMLLGILWCLYDRECAWALTILGISLIALWICRQELSSVYMGTYVKAAAVVYLVLLAVAAFLTRRAVGNGGRLGRFQVLPAKADPMPIYAACGLSALAMLSALVDKTVAYYAMWALAIVVFALAVYYTVKQL